MESTAPDLRDRAKRATNVADADVTLLGGGTAEVQSQSDPDKTYLVDIDLADVTASSCECPDHVYRGTTCKHLLAAAAELGVVDLEN
jgi:uncharacterized Zn finger protein